MPPDPGPRESDSSRTASPATLGGDRAAKPLGRGLEDISHLFLPRTADEAAVAEHPSTRSPEPQPAGGSGALLLRTGRALTRDQLATALRQFDGVFEEGMRGIDSNVPCDPCGEIDVIAVDRASQLAIIDFETTPNDGLLLRGMDHVEWVMRNSANLRRMYPLIDFSQPPRLFLVAPQFSPLVDRVIGWSTRPHIARFKYHVVHVFGRTGILFELVDAG